MRGLLSWALVVAALLCGAQAEAGPTPMAPQPMAPMPQTILAPLPAPPVPFAPATAALGTAYSAIARAAVVDPAAAQRAQFAYRLALSRLKMGDSAGAAAYAASALAIANGGTAGALTGIQAGPLGSSAAAPPVKAYGSFGDVTLPAYLIAARDRIWSANSRGVVVTAATRHLRAAVDAWLDGDAARARREAHAATAALSVSR
jgi:hypothetical protein